MDPHLASPFLMNAAEKSSVQRKIFLTKGAGSARQK